MLGVSGSGFEVSLQEDSEVVIGAFGVVGFYRVFARLCGLQSDIGGRPTCNGILNDRTLLQVAGLLS